MRAADLYEAHAAFERRGCGPEDRNKIQNRLLKDSADKCEHFLNDLTSEAVQAHKPNRLTFQRTVDRLRVEPHDILHVGDSGVDDVPAAKAAALRVAWLNRDGRTRRPDVPPPDFEMADLAALSGLL